MSFTVFLGNLPIWVTADDIKQWLAAEDLVADAVKVIRNHETQESKGFAFVEAPTSDEMQSIIRRFDRAPLEDRLLRANPAQPPKGKDAPRGAQATAAAPNAVPRSTADRGATDRNTSDRNTSDRSSTDRSTTDRSTTDRTATDRTATDRPNTEQRPDRKKRGGRNREQSPRSAFATELAKVL